MDSTNLTRRMFLIGVAAGGASLTQPKLFAQSGTKVSGQSMKICVFSKESSFYQFGQHFCLKCPENVFTILYIIGYMLALILFVIFMV